MKKGTVYYQTMSGVLNLVHVVNNVPYKRPLQIKATLNRFRVERGKGLLIVVNDGNYALEADAVLYLLMRVLGTKFQWLNSVVYCTVNMFSSSPLTAKPTLLWVHTTRARVANVDDSFVMALFRGWSAYLETLTGEPIELIQVQDPRVVEHIKYAKGLSNP